jgi:tryptophan synthase beta chain
VNVFGDIKILLSTEELPDKWYNILPDLPESLPPPLNPVTMQPIDPKDLEAIFPKTIVQQEISSENFIRIPEEVREAYLRFGRPTPLFRAKRLEKFLKTPAKIYYKREDLSPTGSHKTNTAIAQAYYSMKENVERLTTETGAGQWGSALSLASNYFGIKCLVFMVKCSYEQKPYRRIVIQSYGADVVASPSNLTEFGKKILKENPNHSGSLGIAISEAIETTVKNSNTKYSLGSVLNHVLMHQTIIGLETKKQFELIDEYPDVMIGCIGGGSNFAGFAYPFIRDKLKKKTETEFLAVEPEAVPSITKGEYEYDFGDTAELTPLIKMYTLGHNFIPPSIHAGGLRYHGKAPTLSLLAKHGIVKAIAYSQIETFEAGSIFAKTEGIIPAPETSHAIKSVIDEALKCKKSGEKKVIAFNFSGHGLLDLKGYEDFMEGRLK